VQADILKEVQAQNECIFQMDFAIRMMGDIQAYFIEHGIDKFYSASISGYHIGEAGASPVQELAFTLANGFTYVETYLARGFPINAFAPNLSFFFRVSHEAEWLAYGAVCRKIWAVAMRDIYRGNARSQMFKFHTQTSGRALQAQEWDTLNPLRQTYHALLALLANTNSLHVDAADEPMTTPGGK
jgi:methylmalonyl-CoA mutase